MARKMCQVQANSKDRRTKSHLECFKPHESVKAVLDKSEHEAEDIHPASFDSGYASEVKLSNKNLRGSSECALSIDSSDQESDISNVLLEQETMSGQGHTNSPDLSN